MKLKSNKTFKGTLAMKTTMHELEHELKHKLEIRKTTKWWQLPKTSLLKLSPFEVSGLWITQDQLNVTKNELGKTNVRSLKRRKQTSNRTEAIIKL
jgi:hypothetical protein